MELIQAIKAALPHMAKPVDRLTHLEGVWCIGDYLYATDRLTLVAIHVPEHGLGDFFIRRQDAKELTRVSTHTLPEQVIQKLRKNNGDYQGAMKVLKQWERAHVGAGEMHFNPKYLSRFSPSPFKGNDHMIIEQARRRNDALTANRPVRITFQGVPAAEYCALVMPIRQSSL